MKRFFLFLALVFAFSLGGVSARPADELNGEFEAFAKKISSKDADVKKFKESLKTFAGKFVLTERVAEMSEPLLEDAAREVMLAYFMAHYEGRGSTYRLREYKDAFRKLFVDRTKKAQGDLGKLAPLVKGLAAVVTEKDELSVRLRKFLEKENATMLIYAAHVHPFTDPDPYVLEFHTLFVPDDEGNRTIPPALLSKAKPVLEKTRELIAVQEKTVPKMEKFVAKIAKDDDLHVRLREALKHPLMVSLMVRGALKRDPAADLKKLPDALVAQLNPVFQKRGKELVILPDRRQNLVDSLGKFDVAMELWYEWKWLAQKYADSIADDKALAGWREVVFSEMILAMLMEKLKDRKPLDAKLVFEKYTVIGRALAPWKDGKRRLNPHFRLAVRLALDELEKMEKRYNALSEPLKEFSAGFEDKELRACYEAQGGRVVLISRLYEAAGVSKKKDFDGWVERYFTRKRKSYEPHSRFEKELETILARLDEVKAELKASDRPVALDLKKLRYEKSHIHLLRSSIFLNPRTARGWQIYGMEFDDHYAARRWGLFEYDGCVSRDIASFRERLHKRKDTLAELVKTHDKLIILINYMPTWLSRSRDTRTFEGYWKNANACGPKDYKKWRELVRETAKFMKQFGKDVELYYEFWNEPDGMYWQEGVDEFLKLYEETAKAIRSVDRRAKIGGCAVNQWDGKLKKSPDRDMLTLELIRYAKKKKLPLDFVSWHVFGRPVSAIKEAKEAFEKELRSVGYTKMPEFIISEWSHPGRQTGYAAGSMAEYMLGFYKAKVDIQTISCWEEFHQIPDPKGFAPWGMITQAGRKKTPYHVHKFFDRISRGSKGVAVIEKEKGARIVVSKKAKNEYDILLWEPKYSAALTAAIEYLKSAGMTQEDLGKYRAIDTLERFIKAGISGQEKWKDEFKEAQKKYREKENWKNRLSLDFDYNRIEVLSCQSVRTALEYPQVFVYKNRLMCELPGYGVLRLRVRVRE
ncbi:MAG: hypothetical protein E3J72_09150 [Planctomycetota bacterium]|nr:MAG: hypothetical protein E3J72_09150 [Planctomycetota bacterium]